MRAGTAVTAVPHALAAWVIGAYHAFAQALPDWGWLELIKAVDYLLQVAAKEHTFDNSRIHSDFPELRAQEEDDERAFMRIRARRQLAVRGERAEAQSRYADEDGALDGAVRRLLLPRAARRPRSPLFATSPQGSPARGSGLGLRAARANDGGTLETVG